MNLFGFRIECEWHTTLKTTKKTWWTTATANYNNATCIRIREWMQQQLLQPADIRYAICCCFFLFFLLRIIFIVFRWLLILIKLLYTGLIWMPWGVLQAFINGQEMKKKLNCYLMNFKSTVGFDWVVTYFSHANHMGVALL